MIIRLISLLLTSAILADCGSDKQRPPLSDNVVILAFGDSLIHGTGAQKTESCPAILENLIHCKVVNAGIPDGVSESGLKQLPAQIEQHRPNGCKPWNVCNYARLINLNGMKEKIVPSPWGEG